MTAPSHRVMLNLGADPRPIAGAVSIEKRQFPGVDIVLDLENGLSSSGIREGMSMTLDEMSVVLKKVHA